MMHQFFKHYVDDVGHDMSAVGGRFGDMPQPGPA
jgi:hypothetical protein